MKQNTGRILPFIIAAGLVFMLGSLRFGWLDVFFFGAEHATVKGIDFFALPKSYLNLLEGRSLFDTWGGTPYGPYATWYLAHPAFSVFIASWFSFFGPWTAYVLFTIFSVILLACMARQIAQLSLSSQNKNLAYLFSLVGFPVFWMLYVGNMHAPLVLALGLLFCSLVRFKDGDLKKGRQLLMAGLLISLFTKPIVVLMLPLFLLMKETRPTTLIALLIYAVVSFLFIAVPLLNPEAIGLNEVMRLSGDPSFVKENMNIYKNNFALNKYMLDNSIHWLNLVAQSEHKLIHIDVFSLPVFMYNLAGDLPSAIFKLPVLLCLGISLAAGLIRDHLKRLEFALYLCMSISLCFFLSYNTVWEYQYASVVALTALLPIMKEKGYLCGQRMYKTLLICGVLISLPSLYFLVRSGNLESDASLSIIRLTRILPVVVMFICLILLSIRILKKSQVGEEMRKIIREPGKLFFQ